MSYKAEILAAGEKDWTANGLRFATELEAQNYAADLACRWTAVLKWRAVPSTEPVSHAYENSRVLAVVVVPS